MVKKALSQSSSQLCCGVDCFRSLVERPDDGRPLGLVNAGSLRGDPAPHDPYAARVTASVRGGGDLLFSPRLSGQGRGGCSRQEVPEAIGVGAKSLPRAIAVGSVETRCSRPLTLRTFGGCRRSEGDFRPARQSSQPRIPVVRDARAVLGRARGNIHLQKSYERTRPGRRTRIAGEQGSSRRFRTSMNTCGGCPAGQRAQRFTRASKGSSP